MIHHDLHLSSFGFAAAIMLLSAALAQAEEIEVPLSGARLAEITIASTEFNYAPETVRVPAGRGVTVILDNSGAETEHGSFCLLSASACKRRPARSFARQLSSIRRANMNFPVICPVTAKPA